MLTDLLKKGALPQLESAVETEFRRARNLSSTDSLLNEGHKFSGGRFRLNDNFGVGERELVFLFNSYEIAAGAAGPTELAIPYQSIGQLLKPELQLLGWP